MRQSPEQTRFNSGEYDGSMKARRDTSEYGGACQNMENWVPTAQGGIIRRSGSWYGGLKLDPPPVPPGPPEPPQGPFPRDYYTDGELHMYSVRRRLRDDYTGPLLWVNTIERELPDFPIQSSIEPVNGQYWIDEASVFAAFLSLVPNEVNGQRHLYCYSVPDQTDSVSPLDLTAPLGSGLRPPLFAYTGDFA